MIVTHSFDLLIMDPNSFLQLVHEFCMLLSIIHGSVLVLKNDFQPNVEQRNTFSITSFHFTTERLEFLREKKTTMFTLTLVQEARHLIQSQLGGVPHESLILLALPP